MLCEIGYGIMRTVEVFLLQALFHNRVINVSWQKSARRDRRVYTSREPFGIDRPE